MDDPSAQSGYYREIARAFLARRGGALVLSPKDQAAIAAWEEKRVPLRVVLEGIARTFDLLKARGRNTRAVSLAFCDREVEAAFAQYRDRAAGRPKGLEAAAPRPGKSKREKARGEVSKALEALPAGQDEMRGLLRSAIEALSASDPDEAALERLDAGIEEALWRGASDADKARASAEAKTTLKGRTGPDLEDAVRRRVILAARARLRVPHVALHYH